MCPNTDDRYTIYCKVCDGDLVTLIQLDDSDYRCTVCNTVYTDEDGVMDKVVAAEMYSLYRGAKRAGLIYDKELDDNYNRR
jgi:hypothetical protein